MITTVTPAGVAENKRLLSLAEHGETNVEQCVCMIAGVTSTVRWRISWSAGNEGCACTWATPAPQRPDACRDRHEHRDERDRAHL